jgi:DNA-binding response OmpR family regulator
MVRTILCVEDEVKILNNNAKALGDDGYNVLTAETVAQAKEHLAKTRPDAIILDIMLPDGNGLEFLAELRSQGNKILVLLLTAWGKPSDIARGLRAGANDYISKPFEYEVLLARLETMFRNAEEMPETITRGAVKLNNSSMAVYVNGENAGLTPQEFSLLKFFIQNENRFLKAEYVYEKVWGQPMAGDNNAVKIAVSRLRKKLEDSGVMIFFDDEKKGYFFTAT